MDVTVVLPAFNEADHVEKEVARITSALESSPYAFEIIVVDDGSTDGTSQVVENLPHVRVIRFDQNRGSGTARRVGTMEAKGRWTVWTDADMTYPNERIPEFIDQLEAGGIHQIVGARRSEEGTLKFLRVPAKWLIRRFAEYLVGTKIPDLNSGLRAFSTERSRPFLGLLPPGFSCVTTITLAFLANGLVIRYEPIDYNKRAGRSHFHPVKDAYRYILQIIRMTAFFAPLKVFMPIALGLLAIGVVKFVVDMIITPFYLPTNTVLILLTSLILFTLGLLADLIVRLFAYR